MIQDYPDAITIQTHDPSGVSYTLSGVKNLEFESGYNGYFQARFDLQRDFNYGWPDLGLAFQLYAYSGLNEVWHGLIWNYAPRKNSGSNADTVGVTALGYYASTSWLAFPSVADRNSGVDGVIPVGSPESQLSYLLTHGYLPHLVAGTFAATGLTNNVFSTPNGGTDEMRVAKVVEAICNASTTSNQVVLPQVWNDRKFGTKTVPTDPANLSPRYVVSIRNVETMDLERSLNGVVNRQIGRHVSDADGSLNRVEADDTTSQNVLAIDYTGSGTKTPIIIDDIVDLTGLGKTSIASATLLVTTRLGNTRRIQHQSRGITVSQDWTIFDTTLGRVIRNCEVRAGEWLQIPDLYPRLSLTGSGTVAGDISITDKFLISKTSYRAHEDGSGMLTITPEVSANLAELVSGQNQ